MNCCSTHLIAMCLSSTLNCNSDGFLSSTSSCCVKHEKSVYLVLDWMLQCNIVFQVQILARTLAILTFFCGLLQLLEEKSVLVSPPSTLVISVVMFWEGSHKSCQHYYFVKQSEVCIIVIYWWPSRKSQAVIIDYVFTAEHTCKVFTKWKSFVILLHITFDMIWSKKKWEEG